MTGELHNRASAPFTLKAKLRPAAEQLASASGVRWARRNVVVEMACRGDCLIISRRGNDRASLLLAANEGARGPRARCRATEVTPPLFFNRHQGVYMTPWVKIGESSAAVHCGEPEGLYLAIGAENNFWSKGQAAIGRHLRGEMAHIEIAPMTFNRRRDNRRCSRGWWRLFARRAFRRRH